MKGVVLKQLPHNFAGLEIDQLVVGKLFALNYEWVKAV